MKKLSSGVDAIFVMTGGKWKTCGWGQVRFKWMNAFVNMPKKPFFPCHEQISRTKFIITCRKHLQKMSFVPRKQRKARSRYAKAQQRPRPTKIPFFLLFCTNPYTFPFGANVVTTLFRKTKGNESFPLPQSPISARGITWKKMYHTSAIHRWKAETFLFPMM